MNDEQNDNENGSEINGAGKETPAQGSTPEDGSPGANLQDEYYAVDHAKRDVLSTIGDGEMHDEGLAGAGEVSSDIQSSTDQITDEQDEAETYDSEQ